MEPPIGADRGRNRYESIGSGDISNRFCCLNRILGTGREKTMIDDGRKRARRAKREPIIYYRLYCTS
jgi:hypothetical protein